MSVDVSARDARKALYDLISADTLTSTVGAGSTASVVQLGAGEAASWNKHDLVNINEEVVQITATDTGADTITVAPDLSTIPSDGDTVGGGWREWARTPTSSDEWLYVSKIYGDHPVEDAINSSTNDPQVVGVLTHIDDTVQFGEFLRSDFRFRIIGTDLEYAEGAMRRVRSIVHRRPSALSFVNATAYRLEVGPITSPAGRDMMHEFDLPIIVSFAPNN